MDEPTQRPLDWAEVARQRAGSALGDPLIYRAQVDSTNALAAALAPEQAPPGAVIVADHQTSGRGRLGRRWLAAPASGLTFTVVLGLRAPAWPTPMASGLAVVEALAEIGIGATLKWPNDVLIGGRKCAGILIETRRVGDAYWLLAGIGINVRAADPSLPNATYLDAHVRQPVQREQLLVHVLERLEHWYTVAAERPARVRDAWQARLDTLGKQVRVQTPNGQIAGLAADIAEDGALIVRLADGSAQAVQAGDVTLATK